MVFVMVLIKINSSKPCAAGAVGVICLFVHYCCSARFSIKTLLENPVVSIETLSNTFLSSLRQYRTHSGFVQK